MEPIKFFDLLNVADDPTPSLSAATLWPRDHVQPTTGMLVTGTDPEDYRDLMEYLQDALKFRAVYPGVSPDRVDHAGETIPGRVGISAEVVVKNPITVRPLVLSQMPDIAFILHDTPDPPDSLGYRPARLYVTQADTGVELVIEGLPVEIRVPSVLLAPLEPKTGIDSGDVEQVVELTEPFEPGVYDSLAVILRDMSMSSIFVHVRVRMTEELDFIIEPAVPISIGPCRFNGLPCHGLHDLNLVPSPRLRGDHNEGEQALEWTRHTLNPLDRLLEDARYSGVLTVRTVDLNDDRTPLKEIRERLNSEQATEEQVEFVLEDIALPFWSLAAPLPIPLHALFGLRRAIERGDDIDEAFNLVNPPSIDVGDYRLIFEQLLLRTPASLNPLDQFLFLKMALQREEDIGNGDGAGTIGIDDEWTLQLGWRFPEGRLPIVIADAEIKFRGLKLGISLKRMAFEISQGTEGTRPEYKWHNYFQVLFDLELTTKATGRSKRFKLRSLSGKDLELPIYDFGWNLDGLSVGSMAFPEGVQLIFGEKVRLILIIEEVGWITDNNGGRYFSFSGGVSLFRGTGEANRTPEAGAGSAAISEEKGKGGGIRFYRLRWRTGGNPDAPFLLLDGITLALSLGSFSLTGFGMISEFIQDGHEYKEFGFGLQVSFKAGNTEYLIGAQLFYGTVSGEVDNFSYWLVGAQFNPIPISGGVSFVNLRGLVAINLMPNLPPPDGHDQNMRLFRWYRDNYAAAASFKITEQSLENLKSEGVSHDVLEQLEGIKDREVRVEDEFFDLLKVTIGEEQASEYKSLILKHASAFTLSSNRKLLAWMPQDDAWAFSVGLGVSWGGQKTIEIDGFFFFHKSSGERGFLLAFELRMFGKPDPVGFGVLEFDVERSKWHLLLGVAFSIGHVMPEGIADSFFDSLASLTGTLYIGNKPATVALGQLNDQTTWLTLRFRSPGFIEMDALVAYCFHIVDVPEGPYGSGLIVSLKGGREFGIGKVQVYGSFGFIIGAWRNESKAIGLVAWLELGFRIKVFWVFNFGASLKVEFDFLGPDPTYRRLGVEVRIETPWYLPDATFRYEHIWDEPDTQRLDLVSTPVIAAEALHPGTQTQTPLAVTPLTGNAINESTVYSMNRLRTLNAPTLPPDALDDLTPVAVDSTIALNFKPSVDNKTAVGENTPVGAGRQAPVDPAENDLSITYELFEIGIRRRPRFGLNANTWTTLLAPEDTHLDTPADFLPDTGTDVSFEWDKDVLRLGRWDPRRLLINASTPYSFVISNPEADEAIVRVDVGWPCCSPKEREPHWHELDFMDTPFGIRAPSFQTFTESSSTLHWIGGRLPIVRLGLAAPSGWHAATVDFVQRGSGVFASIDFDQPVVECEIYAYWFGHSFSLELIVDAYNGLELVDQQTFKLFNPNPPAPIRVEIPNGMTSVLLRRTGNPPDGEPHPEEAMTNWIEFIQIRYRTLQEELDRTAEEEKCKAQEERALSVSGKLVWLPNHEYEVSLTTQVILEHEKTEAQSAQIKQKVFFRTKGLPGLNAVERIGDELEPYVEARYPGPIPQTLYRAEPLALAFNEHFNILAPLDQVPPEDAPLERQQLLEWVLAVEKMGNGGDGQRISQTSPDWIVAHRTLPLPPLPFPPIVLVVRQAVTHDPFRRRFENILHRPEGCNVPRPLLHRSQVLFHKPVDPEATPDAPQRWPSRSTFRVNVRRKGGPFVERKPFEINDFTAFDFANEGEPSGDPWRVTNGDMHVQNAPSDGVRRLAVFGDSDWDHFQIYTTVDPEGGAAGVAVGGAELPSVFKAILVLVDENSGRLRLVEFRNGVATELGSELLDVEASAPYLLQVLAFDDRLRARVGDTTVEAAREEVRAGRLALVAQDGGAFHDLVVESLDVYRFYFQSSCFVDFEEHIGSFEDDVTVIPFSLTGIADASEIVTLLTDTAVEIETLMVADADPEQRQRLFDRWVQTLALPLRQQTERLELSQLVDADDNTHLLLLESPEPLPFSQDVSLAVTRRTVSPIPPREFPAELIELATTIAFEDNRVHATIANNALLKILALTKRLVRAGARGRSLEYHVYAITLRRSEQGEAIFSGKRTEVIRPRPGLPILHPLLVLLKELRANQFALLDENDKLVVPQMIPIIEVIDAPVPLRVLTNGSETQALLIPMDKGNDSDALLASGDYRFEFEIDRVRFRSHVPDDTSNYRSQTMILAHL